ncbi:MAG: phenylalanine--tRNA ligase subunit beta, partial [Chloroflexi bacterium]|nr:phenylalanine--tRNA ligase subunit beta [Chloroflexota bacterium]
MRVSLKWLRELVDFDIPPEELAQRLTMAGLEVSSIHRVGGGWENVLVGQVVALEQHPNADRLMLATVELGGEQITVVCGAPNVAAGQKVAFARVGARLLDPESDRLETLKAARIRGVRSEGMVCSERELGLGDDHTGILVLPPDAPPGQPLDGYLGDSIFETEVTPNRPDWLSMLGVAWEVAALTGGTVHMPDVTYSEGGRTIESLDPVGVEAPDLAPRYTASLVTGLTVAPAPGWMQLRLQAAGVRPISNVVDITNYVMLEMGQPLHAFDYDSLRGHRVIVRRARPGEPLTTLDGRAHELTGEDLVIADADIAVGLAGVMGGAESEVSERTQAVLLESATFDQASIRRTVQRHRIEVGNKRGTEASQRFEKGLPPDLAPVALRRATNLLVDLCGGTAAQGIVDTYANPAPRPPVRLTSRRLFQVLGFDPGAERVSATLSSLGFGVRTAHPEPVKGRVDDAVDVTVPFWRNDVSIPDDLAEEVARIIGYDAIPTTLPRGALPEERQDPLRDLREEARDALASLGMQEVITYALVSRELLERTAPAGSPEPLKVWNPISLQ